MLILVRMNERRLRRKVGTRYMRFYPRRMKGIEGGVIKVEPKWLGMGEYVIFRTLELKFLGRSHYKKLLHQNHMLSYIWWKRFVSFK